MGTFYRKVGGVIFERTTSGGGGDPLIEITAKGVKVTILKDKRIFTATEFAAFCNEENAKHYVREHIDPLLKWLGERGECPAR